MKRLAAPLFFALAVLVACGDDGGEKPTPTETPVATSTAVSGQIPNKIDGVVVRQLAVGKEVQVPDGFTFIVQVGCIECHCPCVNGLVALSRGASGAAEIAILFPPASGLPPRTVGDMKSPEGVRQDEPYLNGGFVTTGGGSQIGVAVCSRGSCGPIDEGTADAQTTVYRSSDGGASWAALGTLDGVYYAEAIVEGGVVISGPNGPARQAEFRYQDFPAGETIGPPAQAAPGSPLSLPDGGLVWRTTDRHYVRGDGSSLLALDVEPIDRIAVGPSGDGLVIQWAAQPVESVQGFSAVGFVGVVADDGQLRDVLSAPAGRLEFGGWLDSKQAIANAWVIPTGAEFSLNYWRLVVVDVAAAIVHPVVMTNRVENPSVQPGIVRSVLAVRATFSP